MAWRVARSLLVLRDQLNAAHPGRNKSADGTIGDAAHQSGTSDHNPDAAGVVRALDITHDPGHGVDIGQLAEALRQSRDPRVKYMIANRRIFAGAAGPSPWVWRSYGGSDPHTGHLHLSVVADGRADDKALWSIGAAPTPPEGGLDMATIDDLYTTLRAIDNRVREGVLNGVSPMNDTPGEGDGKSVWLVEQIRAMREQLAATDLRVRAGVLTGTAVVDDPGEGPQHPVWLVQQIQALQAAVAGLSAPQWTDAQVAAFGDRVATALGSRIDQLQADVDRLQAALAAAGTAAQG